MPSSPRVPVPPLVFALALLAYAATPWANVYSDGIHLARLVEASPQPYYNVLYVTLGWLVHRGLRPLLGWEAFEALRWMSLVCAAASAAVAARLARRAGWGARGQLGWGALFALTPGVWFFAQTVEVHGLQILGAALATELALVARGRERRIAIALVAAAALLVVLTHATAVLFVPALLALAQGADASRGVPVERLLRGKGLLWTLGSTALAAAVVWFLAFRVERSPWLRPVQAPVGFGVAYLERLRDDPLFGPGEMLSYVVDELVRPSGLLLPAALLGLFVAGRRRGAFGFLALLVPYFVLFLQSGVREGGGYFTTLYPLMLWLGAATCARLRLPRGAPFAAAVAAMLLLAQGLLAWRHRAQLDRGRDARAWIAEVEEVCPPGSVLVTVSLPRWHALSYSPARYAGTDLLRQFQLAPFSEVEAVAREWLGIIGNDVVSGKRTFLDADLFAGTDEPPYYSVFRRLLAEMPARLEPRPDRAGRPLMFEVLATDAGVDGGG